MIRTRICKSCENEFHYEFGPGRDRLHCSEKCREEYRLRIRAPKSKWARCAEPCCTNTVRSPNSPICNRHYSAKAKLRAGICIVHKCTKPATRVGHGMCEMHYGRIRRNGTTNEREPRGVYAASHGYLLLFSKGHPLAAKNGATYVHRLVLHEQIGDGVHACHWCGGEVEWKGKGKRKLVVDHLDGSKENNEPANLVPSCHRCNSARGLFMHWVMRHKDDPFLAALFRIALAA